MLKRYAIWDKESEVYTPGTDPNLKGFTYSTPAGTSRFTAEEWAMLHPAPPSAIIVCSAGDYNGAFFGTLSQMVQIYSSSGADFSKAKTPEKILEVIEAFEDSQNAPSDESSPEERIAAALELANTFNMPSVNEDDPDVD
jgi:hypothetical protein